VKDAEILQFHREIVAIPSVSGNEAEVQARIESRLADRGVEIERVGDSLLAIAGEGPVVLLDTHYDTVPASSEWTRDPYDVEVAQGRVYGLGSNDAKASVAAMCAAFVRLSSESLPITLALGLAAGEERDSHGTADLLAELERRGQKPVAAVVGEPTGLDIAVAQKGLLVAQIVADGKAVHAAHGEKLGARNAIRRLARDLVSIERVDLGPDHDLLGPTTLEPTMIEGGTARNVIPSEARVTLDLRTVPSLTHDELVERLEKAVRGKVEVVSKRLEPCATDPEDPIVVAARAARPDARLYGSPTMSDMALLSGIPAIKCGPGETERSHTPDEYVLETEILEGFRFYTALLRAYAEKAWAAE